MRQRRITWSRLTALLPDVLDPAAHDVPSGLSQGLAGTHAGPLLPAGRRFRHDEG